MTDGEQQTHWTLDKRIPVGLLVGLIIQTGVFLFWIGGLSAQVAQNTAELKAKQADASRIAVTETKIDNLNTSINRLTNTIDRLLQRSPNP